MRLGRRLSNGAERQKGKKREDDRPPCSTTKLRGTPTRLPQMDPDKLQDVVAVALTIGGLVVAARSRLGAALARRIAGEGREPPYQERILALQDDVALLRSQMQEAQERLDFTERLLARLKPPRDPGA